MEQKLSHPRITVLMAVYNGERYLKDAIDSILTQTYAAFEFIIIDDASTDGTASILKSYSDPRIIVVKNESNIGLTRSLNRGLAMARGEYIARMDADDISLPQRLETQLRFLDSNPQVTLVGSAAERIDENGISASNIPTLSDIIMIRYSFALGKPVFIHSSWFFRTKIIRDDLDGYDENFKNAQDFELLSRLIEKYKITNIPEVLLKFRVHRESITSKLHGRKNPSEIQGLTVFLRNIRTYAPVTEEEFYRLYNTKTVGAHNFIDLVRSLRTLRKIQRAFVKKEKPGHVTKANIQNSYRNTIKTILIKYLNRRNTQTN